MTSLHPRAIRGSWIAPFLLALLGAALALAMAAARPPSAMALSCIAPPPIGEAVATAEIAFVGTVTAVANDGKLASVAVESIWAGPDMPGTIQLGSGRPANDPEAVWDRTYTAGTRYLFFPYVEEGKLVDGPCSFTQEWQADFEKVRPSTAREPMPTTPEPEDPLAALGGLVLPAIGVGILAVVVIGGAMIVSRRQAG